jgi:hypothetical protein
MCFYDQSVIVISLSMSLCSTAYLFPFDDFWPRNIFLKPKSDFVDFSRVNREFGDAFRLVTFDPQLDVVLKHTKYLFYIFSINSYFILVWKGFKGVVANFCDNRAKILSRKALRDKILIKKPLDGLHFSKPN